MYFFVKSLLDFNYHNNGTKNVPETCNMAIERKFCVLEVILLVWECKTDNKTIRLQKKFFASDSMYFIFETINVRNTKLFLWVTVEKWDLFFSDILDEYFYFCIAKNPLTLFTLTGLPEIKVQVFHWSEIFE